MANASLDETICLLIDQYKVKAEETVNNADINKETRSCLHNLITDNMTVLNNIRMAVF